MDKIRRAKLEIIYFHGSLEIKTIVLRATLLSIMVAYFPEVYHVYEHVKDYIRVMQIVCFFCSLVFICLDLLHSVQIRGIPQRHPVK